MHDGTEGGYNRIQVQLMYYPLPSNVVHGGKAPRQHAMEATRKWPRSHSQQFAPGGVWDSRQCFLFKDSPSPSLSKREKASLNSAICSSVSWSAMVDSFLLLQYCKKAKVTLWVKSGFVLLLLWGFLALVCAPRGFGQAALLRPTARIFGVVGDDRCKILPFKRSAPKKNHVEQRTAGDSNLWRKSRYPNYDVPTIERMARLRSVLLYNFCRLASKPSIYYAPLFITALTALVMHACAFVQIY